MYTTRTFYISYINLNIPQKTFIYLLLHIMFSWLPWNYSFTEGACFVTLLVTTEAALQSGAQVFIPSIYYCDFNAMYCLWCIILHTETCNRLFLNMSFYMCTLIYHNVTFTCNPTPVNCENHILAPTSFLADGYCYHFARVWCKG